ncbi:MAG: hypothetical protein AB7H90_19540 [Alphaproteobacteria bacterium]
MTISVPTLVLIFLLIRAVWYISRLLTRSADALERRRRSAAARPRRPGAIEDLVSCRTCGDYVSPGARDCGRPACPQAR